MKVSNKLKYFEEVVNEDLNEEMQKVTSYIEAELNENKEKVKKSEKIISAEKLKIEDEKIERSKNKEYIDTLSIIRKDQINYKNKLTDKLFENVKNQLIHFSSSKDYEPYILENIKNIYSKYNNIEIVMMEKDKAILDKISTLFNIKTETTSENFIGGYKAFITDKNALVDDTFLYKLEEEKENFSLLRIQS